MISAEGSGGAIRARAALRKPLLLAGALIVVGWTLVLIQAERSVFGRVPLLDEVYYLDRAADIRAGQWIPDDPHFMSPLYPLLAAATGAGGGVPADRVLDGAQLRGLRLLQIGCWLGTLVLIRLLARRLVPPDWPPVERRLALWVPVLLFALYRPAAVYSLAILLELPLLFLVTWAIYLLCGPAGPRRRADLLVLGVVLGLAGLLRGTALLLVPVVLGSLWMRRSPVRSLAVWGWFLVGLLVTLAPATVHNSRLAGRLVGPTVNGGVNLYIGQGPAANGFYVAAVPGDWRLDPAGRVFWAERLDRDEISLAEADRLWIAEAWRHMRADPFRVLRLTTRKLWLQIQGWEIDQLTPLAGWTETVPLLRLMVVPYALFVILGLVGLAGLRGQRVAGILAAALLVMMLGQSLFFVVSRYRLVLVPLWSVLAGVGAVRLRRRGRAGWTVALVAAILTVPWGLNQVREGWAALAQANAALRWAHVGTAEGSASALQRAADLYRESLTRVDDRPASWLGLAAVLAAQGQSDARAEALRNGIDRVDDPYELQKVLLALELEIGRTDAALALARAILRARPGDPDTLHNITILLARTGRQEEALAAAEELRRVHPGDPRGHIDVGVLLARSGRRQEAKAAFENGLRFCPDHPDLLQNLSLLSD